MQILPSMSLHSSWEDKVLVYESLRAECPYLGPEEQEESKILTDANKKDSRADKSFCKAQNRVKHGRSFCLSEVPVICAVQGGDNLCAAFP